MSVPNNANTFLPPSPVAPKFLVVTDITNAVNAVVTVSTANNYFAGQLFYFSVPATYGMSQINGLTGQILSVDNSNLIFTTDVNTTQFDIFAAPSPFQEQPATVSCAGSRNLTLNNDNSINVPFHSIDGNIGN